MAETMKLTDDQKREISWLILRPKNATSNRDRDRVRTKLKKLGLIRFNRKTWMWEVLPGAMAALSEGGE